MRTTNLLLVGVALVFAACGGDSDNGGARGEILDDAAAEAAALDENDIDCSQIINVDGESSVEANQNCGSGNRIGSSGQTGDNSSDRHDTTTGAS